MKDLFVYNHRSNETYIYYLVEAGLAHKKAIQIISHILNAQHIWNCRINGEQVNRNPFDMIALGDLFKFNNDVHKATLKIIDELELSQNIEYVNTKGEIFDNEVQEVLNHILFHSTHHRAQIGVFFNKFNITPPNTDYITYKRKKLSLSFN